MAVAAGRRRTAVHDSDEAGHRLGGEVRGVGRRPGLVTPRAMFGALLVAAAAVLGFAGYTSATADHRLGYVVAARQLSPGRRIGPADVRTAPMQLPAALSATREFRDPATVIGAVVVAPVAPGELVQASDVARTGPGQRQVSFAIDPSRAVDGTLRPGETVDLLATYGTGSDARTLTVVAAATIVAVDDQAGGLSGQSSQTVTVGLASAAQAAAVVNAVNAGQVTLVRSDGAPAAGPSSYAEPGGSSPGGSSPGGSSSATIPTGSGGSTSGGSSSGTSPSGPAGGGGP